MPLLVLCVQEPELSLKRVAASALSDIAKHTPELAQGVVDAGQPAGHIDADVLFDVAKDEAYQLQQAACLLVILPATCMWDTVSSWLLLPQAASRKLACLQVLWRIWPLLWSIRMPSSSDRSAADCHELVQCDAPWSLSCAECRPSPLELCSQTLMPAQPEWSCPACLCLPPAHPKLMHTIVTDLRKYTFWSCAT